MKCPHCNSELTYKLTQYKDELDREVKIYRCFNCQGNIVIEPKKRKYNRKPKCQI